MVIRLILMILGFQAGAATAARTLDEVERGELLLRTEQPGQYEPALQLLSRTHISISGMVAEVTVSQRFRNPARTWAEGLYVFPLPETAAVNAMQIQIGDRVIVGEVREKEKARKLFRKARNEGKKAALTEQRRPNLFATAIANIPPGEELIVEISYLQKVSYSNGVFNLRFPMAVTPRYPTPEAFIRDQGDQSDQGSQAGSIELTVDLDPGIPLALVSSTYHDIQIVRQGDLYSISLSQGNEPMDRDFELSWKPTPGQTPRAALFTEQFGGETYALLMVLPPNQQQQTRRIPREIVFVIDTSGSMGGEPIRQAKAALQLAVRSLGSEDQFNVIQFNSTTSAVFRSSRMATEENLNSALHYITDLKSNGGTEMIPAILYALKRGTANRERLRQVVFITDGAVSYEQELFALIKRSLGSSRLFTIGIGSAPNSYFMRKAARFGRGTFTYIGKLDEVQQKMSQLFRLLEHPVSRNIVLTWPRGIVPEGYPTVIPDLYMGEPLVMTARLKKVKGELTVSGEGADGEWHQVLSLEDIRLSNRGIANLWARDKISELDDEIALVGETDFLRGSMTSVALNHQLASRYTSLLAVEKEPSRPANLESRSSRIANARPRGQATRILAYPQTATTAMQKVWLGIAAILLALLIRTWSRRVADRARI